VTLFSFRLSADFVDSYRRRKPPFGFRDAGGNSLGEITFLRTYSRLKQDGFKETWVDVCERVVNGMFSIQKDHCKSNRLPWHDNKAQHSAQDAFDRLFHLKWSPPGRGLWMMGTPIVNEQRNSAALQNCSFISTMEMTKNNPAKPFAFLMEASMLGIGVGFDDKGADKGFTIYSPEKQPPTTYLIADTREGWVDSVSALINAYLRPDQHPLVFDYSQIRPAGEPIKTFGGTAAGPDPLKRLHDAISNLFKDRAGSELTRTDIADLGNLIGVCVVSGNVRRSAELLMGRLDDDTFINLKNYEANPDRAEWGWMSNNSVEVSVGDDLSKIIDGIALNGEPGVIWMDVTRQYGRLIDPVTNADHRAAGYNPCAEQSLESGECCTLVETYLNRHDSLDDFLRTLKYAFLYGKSVTLLPTHWADTNAIMQRNRRIGTSVSGIANFADIHGMTVLREWMNRGYETVRGYDEIYSEWLGIRESIKVTTVKPSGTVSILAGESPGVHWSPGGKYFLRGVVFQKDDPMVQAFKDAGYRVEKSAYTPDTSVYVQFPIESKAERSEKDVTIFEKANLAVLAQRYWSDNSVSVTLSFDAKEEGQHVGTVLHMHDGQLKTVSFLPMGNHVYAQMPYTQITKEQYDKYLERLQPIDLKPVYKGKAIDAAGEAYCTTDACEVPVR
jgi:ribonucleoside-triphosphate reductase